MDGERWAAPPLRPPPGAFLGGSAFPHLRNPCISLAMAEQPLTIWTNYAFPLAAEAILQRGIGRHRLIKSPAMQASNLTAGASDLTVKPAGVALGQAPPAALVRASRVERGQPGRSRGDRDDRA